VGPEDVGSTNACSGTSGLDFSGAESGAFTALSACREEVVLVDGEHLRARLAAGDTCCGGAELAADVVANTKSLTGSVSLFVVANWNIATGTPWRRAAMI
jgi:hypothetical protein